MGYGMTYRTIARAFPVNWIRCGMLRLSRGVIGVEGEKACLTAAGNGRQFGVYRRLHRAGWLVG
jgi:hypothetical protein